jgi:hypothetical protein
MLDKTLINSGSEKQTNLDKLRRYLLDANRFNALSNLFLCLLSTETNNVASHCLKTFGCIACSKSAAEIKFKLSRVNTYGQSQSAHFA